MDSLDARAGYLTFPAGPGDAEALGRVHVESWRETYRGLIAQAYLDAMSAAAHAKRFYAKLMRPGPDEVLLAAADRHGLVGYCEGGPARQAAAPNEAEIATLYLVPEAQGAGLGRRLLTDTARALEGRGAEALVIWVLAENSVARGFYERMGGRLSEKRRGPGPGGQVNEVAYRWADIGGLHLR